MRSLTCVALALIGLCGRASAGYCGGYTQQAYGNYYNAYQQYGSYYYPQVVYNYTYVPPYPPYGAYVPAYSQPYAVQAQAAPAPQKVEIEVRQAPNRIETAGPSQQYAPQQQPAQPQAPAQPAPKAVTPAPKQAEPVNNPAGSFSSFTALATEPVEFIQSDDEDNGTVRLVGNHGVAAASFGVGAGVVRQRSVVRAGFLPRLFAPRVAVSRSVLVAPSFAAVGHGYYGGAAASFFPSRSFASYGYVPSQTFVQRSFATYGVLPQQSFAAAYDTAGRTPAQSPVPQQDVAADCTCTCPTTAQQSFAVPRSYLVPGIVRAPGVGCGHAAGALRSFSGY